MHAADYLTRYVSTMCRRQKSYIFFFQMRLKICCTTCVAIGFLIKYMWVHDNVPLITEERLLLLGLMIKKVTSSFIVELDLCVSRMESFAEFRKTCPAC